MITLTRRHARAALAGVATTAAYLAATKAGPGRPIRAGGLLIIGMTAMAGVLGGSSSVKARTAHTRIDALIPIIGAAMPKSGGTFTGAVTFGAVTINTSLNMTGGNITSVGTLTSTGKINASGQGRADLAWTPNTHQGPAPASYSQSSFDACISRVSDLIDQVSAVSDRADWLRQQLSAGNIVIN